MHELDLSWGGPRHLRVSIWVNEVQGSYCVQIVVVYYVYHAKLGIFLGLQAHKDCL